MPTAPLSSPTSPQHDDAHLARSISRIARRAGDLIMEHYARGVEVKTKSDASPVTVADQEANDLIVEALQSLTPEILIVAEESVDDLAHKADLTERDFWLVDPLDGTKEFINRNGDFTVNIALIRGGTPTLGVVHIPVTGLSYLTLGADEAVLEAPDGSQEPINAREVNLTHPVVMVSRSHLSAETVNYLTRFPTHQQRARGSSLKLCLIASGDADLYPRHGRTMEWDIAAGHAVLKAAGGQVITLAGDPLRYGKPLFENPHFIASGPTVDSLIS